MIVVAVSIAAALTSYLLSVYCEPNVPGQQYLENGIETDGSHSNTHVPSTFNRAQLAMRIMPGELTEANMEQMVSTDAESPLSERFSADVQSKLAEEHNSRV